MPSPLALLNVYITIVVISTFTSIVPVVNAANANVSIDYIKVGACNSSIVVRVGDFCDYIVTIIIPTSGGANTSTDLGVEIIMPDNSTTVMQMSKPQISYVGGNFINAPALYTPDITMTSSLNTSQFDNARLDFGTVVNSGIVSAGNNSQSSIVISFRSVVISSPSYQTNGSQYWVTVGIEFNNVSEIWIGQALFIFSNISSGGSGQLSIGSVSNSSLQIPQGSPFELLVPINYNNTFASNFVFTVTNDNPTQLGLCSAYVRSATSGFSHLPGLGYEISSSLTTTPTSNQISISFGQIVNTQFYNGSAATLSIVVYGRVFKSDGISSYTAGSMTVQVSATSSTTTTRTLTIFAQSAVTPGPLNGSLPTFSVASVVGSVGIYQSLKMTITMTVPSGFSAPVVFDLNGASNTSTPQMKACAIVFQSAGENIGGCDPKCADPSLARRTYASSINSTDYDQFSYDYGVMSNTGPRTTAYVSTVNDVVFDAVFQLLNTTQTVVWPTVSLTLGNNTIWLGNTIVNVTTMSYNVTNTTRPTFQLSYENNATSNQSVTNLGEPRLFYYDIFTQPNGVYTPMVVRITTNETVYGSGVLAASICLVKVLYVGQNLPCVVSTLYNQPQSPFVTYSSRYNQRKNDTVMIQFGPLCNYQTTQTNSDFGRIRLAVYVRIEPTLGDGVTSYVNLDVFYSPSNLWIGQILFTGRNPGSPSNVVGTPLLFPLNSTTQAFNRNALTIVRYGLKIPPASRGVYSALTSSVINEASQQTSVCRVDISPDRGSNVPCSNDISSVFNYNFNGVSAVATTNLGMICSIAPNASALNASLSTDSDTVLVRVFLLATAQSSSTFDLTLANLLPSGQSALGLLSSTLNSGLTGVFGNASSINLLNATTYQQLNDTSNSSFAYLGQDVLIRIQFVLAYNLSTQACYPLLFVFGITAPTANAAYFTNGFIISAGENLMCMKSKAAPILSSGGSTLYNASMQLDLGTLCYYAIDPLNISASTLIVQVHVRVPVTTTVPVNSALSVNVAALVNQNQSSLNTSMSFTVSNYTGYTGFTVFPNDTTSLALGSSNSTKQSGIRQLMTYTFRLYLPSFSQGRLQLWLSSIQMSSSVTIHIVSADILSAGINVGSFMAEYTLGSKYQWTYTSSVAGSTYRDTAYLDLGVVTNTGATVTQQTFSNTTDNYITIQATGYLTDSPPAEQNFTFSFGMVATYVGLNVTTSYAHAVVRNGTERPVMFVNHTDLTSGVYGLGSTYSGMIQYGHLNNSNAECISAQIILYLPTWIQFRSYNSTSLATNYTTDNSSYVIFNLGTLLFNDGGYVTFTLDVGTSSQMAVVYGRFNPSKITIPFELLCRKRPRSNTAVYSNSKVFAFSDIISVPTAMTPVSNYPTLLNTLQPCQFTSSVQGSDASLVLTSGWQTGFRSNQWMLSGGTYLQINFGNLTFIHGIQLSVPVAFAPIRTIQLGYSWDGQSFAVDSMKYIINGSASYVVPLSKPLLIRYLRVYLIDVVQPSDLLTKTSGFILNITGVVNTTSVTVASVCPGGSSILQPRTVLVAPPLQAGLIYANDIYVCDETTTRTSIQCHVLYNGDTTASAKWTALNTTVANILLFVYDAGEQIQSLYGYGQDGVSIVRSDDRGQTWLITDLVEYSDITAKCAASLRVCSASDAYSLMSGVPGWLQLQSGNTLWSASIRGVWTQQSSGTLAFDWFGY